MDEVTLRDVIETDLPVFFEHQQDPQACLMAGFESREEGAFLAHWAKILANPENICQTILHNGQVAGNIGSFTQAGEREVGYWIGRKFWGRGIATRALLSFLGIERTRPLHARVYRPNMASMRVLLKCGFLVTGEESEEILLRLDGEEQGEEPGCRAV